MKGKILSFPGVLPDDKPVLKYKKIDHDKVKSDLNNCKHDHKDGENCDGDCKDEEYQGCTIPHRPVISPSDVIASEQVITIPNNLIRPMNGRIFCIAVDPSEKRTKGGVIMATSFTQLRGDDKIKRAYKRYFVIDVANDLTATYQPITKDGSTSEPRKLKRGDEVFPFFPEEMTDWKVPVVIDWNNGGMTYCVFSDLELAGVGLINLVEEEEKEKEK